MINEPHRSTQAAGRAGQIGKMSNRGYDNDFKSEGPISQFHYLSSCLDDAFATLLATISSLESRLSPVCVPAAADPSLPTFASSEDTAEIIAVMQQYVLRAGYLDARINSILSRLVI